jgi:hypothetical protein
MAYPDGIEILDRSNAVKKVATRTTASVDAPFTEIGHLGSPVDAATNPLPTIQVGKFDAALGDSFMALPSPGLSVWKEFTAAYTTTQTGVALWTPASGKVYVVRQISIDWYGADDGALTVWGSASAAADTAYTEGTDRFLCGNNTCAPSTKGSGGIVRNGLWVGVGATYPVRVTTTNNLDCRVSVGGWEYTL